MAQADPNKRRENPGSSVSERTLWTWLRWYEDGGDIRGLLPHPGDRRRGRPAKSEELHDIIADRLEARWLQRPPWPLTDVALEVVAEVERRNRDRPATEHVPLQRTETEQVRLHTLERMGDGQKATHSSLGQASVCGSNRHAVVRVLQPCTDGV